MLANQYVLILNWWNFKPLLGRLFEFLEDWIVLHVNFGLVEVRSVALIDLVQLGVASVGVQSHHLRLIVYTEGSVGHDKVIWVEQF